MPGAISMVPAPVDPEAQPGRGERLEIVGVGEEGEDLRARPRNQLPSLEQLLVHATGLAVQLAGTLMSESDRLVWTPKRSDWSHFRPTSRMNPGFDGLLWECDGSERIASAFSGRIGSVQMSALIPASGVQGGPRATR